MIIKRTVTVDRPIDSVFAYLSDFTTTTEWDPGTITTIRTSGNGGIGTTYRNTSRFAGRTTELTYVVTDRTPPHRIGLRGENATVVAEDSMDLHEPSPGTTQVTYTARFTFRGLARLAGPLLAPALRRLGDEAQEGLRRSLQSLPPAAGGPSSPSDRV